MPRMDKTGPEGKGCATGRKLGFCQNIENDNTEQKVLGVGLGKRFHTPDRACLGKGKRLKYFQDKKL